jgi:hypothetical protein
LWQVWHYKPIDIEERLAIFEWFFESDLFIGNMNLYFWIPFDYVVAFVAVLHNEGLHVKLATLEKKTWEALNNLDVEKNKITLGLSF